MTFYRIGCEVSGGVTGHRRSYLKEQGIECRFDTHDAAQKALPRSYTNQQGVTFRYWIETVDNKEN